MHVFHSIFLAHTMVLICLLNTIRVATFALKLSYVYKMIANVVTYISDVNIIQNIWIVL